MPAPVDAPVVGIDVIEIRRVAGILDRHGQSALRRVCTDQEKAWVGLDPTRLAAVFTLKEAAIKAMAGRPPGFRWQALQTRAAPPAEPAGVGRMLDGFVADLGSQLCVATGVRPTGVAAEALGDGVEGGGRYLVLDGHVYAVVCFWRDGVG